MNKSFCIKLFTLISFSFILCCCTPTARFKSNSNKKYETSTSSKQTAATFRGFASYYHDKFDGRTTASGEIFNQKLLTAAHKTLPFGTFVRVTNLKNNRQTVVKVNDRGPFVEGRIIDLSFAAAKELDMVADGIAEVMVEVLK